MLVSLAWDAMNLLRSSGRSILNTALGNVLVRGMKECHTLYQTRHLINLQGLVTKCWEHPYCRISSCRQPRSLEGFGCPRLMTGTVTQLPFRLIEYPGLVTLAWQQVTVWLAVEKMGQCFSPSSCQRNWQNQEPLWYYTLGLGRAWCYDDLLGFGCNLDAVAYTWYERGRCWCCCSKLKTIKSLKSVTTLLRWFPPSPIVKVLQVIPLTVFDLGSFERFVDVMSVVTFIYWALDLPGCLGWESPQPTNTTMKEKVQWLLLGTLKTAVNMAAWLSG